MGMNINVFEWKIKVNGFCKILVKFVKKILVEVVNRIK